MSRRQSVPLWLTVTCSAAVCFAVPPTIGVASAVGTFLVNSIQVEGNSNLSDGAQVKTGRASSQIFLQNGSTLTLGVNSAGTVYHDHLSLEQGATEVDRMNGFSIQAAAYSIREAQSSSQGVVRVENDMVEVAALSGSLNVFDARGALLTHIGAGTASAFQTGASPGRNDQSGATPNVNTRLRKEVAAGILLAASLAGLGLAVAAITQPSPTSH